MSPQSRRRAFTLIEMMVVIVIITILLALLTYGVQKVRTRASLSQCANNLRQIGMGVLAFEDKHKHFPHGRQGCDGATTPTPWCTNQSATERNGVSAFTQILPFVEQSALYSKFSQTDPPWSQTSTWQNTNKAALETAVPLYRCPMDPTRLFLRTNNLDMATCSYAMVHGSLGPSQGIDATWKVRNNGMFVYRITHSRDELLDGASNTYFTGEVLDADDTTHSVNLWSVGSRHESCLRSTENPLNTKPGTGVTTSPYGIPLSGAFGSYHLAGGNFLFGDGHVVFTTNSIPLATYRALSTRAGNETVILP